MRHAIVYVDPALHGIDPAVPMDDGHQAAATTEASLSRNMISKVVVIIFSLPIESSSQSLQPEGAPIAKIG
jgi:hypothetical protein